MILMLPLSGRFEKAKVLGLILHSCDIAHPAKRYKEQAVTPRIITKNLSYKNKGKQIFA
jgi:hypothetical protein